mmetsp:Transcript_59162/g.87867  ORF Transcript_59162/g.87867 Transcript_59162/m.87867 type:complete len:326 (+) Transcript_59162:174-1151(+)
MFRNRTKTLQKRYRAILFGKLQPFQGTCCDCVDGKDAFTAYKVVCYTKCVDSIALDFDRRRRYRRKMMLLDESKEKEGHCHNGDDGDDDDDSTWMTTVDLYPHTGRKHQLRKHMKALGCPIWGDQRYGPYSKKTQQTDMNDDDDDGGDDDDEDMDQEEGTDMREDCVIPIKRKNETNKKDPLLIKESNGDDDDDATVAKIAKMSTEETLSLSRKNNTNAMHNSNHSNIHPNVSKNTNSTDSKNSNHSSDTTTPTDMADITPDQNPHYNMCLWAVEISFPPPAEEEEEEEEKKEKRIIRASIDEPEWYSLLRDHQERQWRNRVLTN